MGSGMDNGLNGRLNLNETSNSAIFDGRIAFTVETAHGWDFEWICIFNFD